MNNTPKHAAGKVDTAHADAVLDILDLRDGIGLARLANAIDDPTNALGRDGTFQRMLRPAAPATSTPPAPVAPSHRKTRVALAVAATVAAAASVLAAFPGNAHAAVTRVQPAPSVIVLGASTVTKPFLLSTTVRSPRGFYAGSLYATATVPAGAVPTTIPFLGEGRGRTSTFTVVATVNAKTAKLGYQMWTARDDADPQHGTRATRVKIVRQSKVAPLYVTDIGGGQALVSVQVTHYNPATNGYGPSNLSPVWVQVHSPKGWATVDTITTNALGRATGVLDLDPGYYRVRFVRPEGGTVSAATSVTKSLTVTDGDGGLPWGE